MSRFGRESRMPRHEISDTSEALPGVENIERSLVNFQDAEIGVAHFCPLDAPGRVGEQRLKGFHKNEPQTCTPEESCLGVVLFRLIPNLC